MSTVQPFLHDAVTAFQAGRYEECVARCRALLASRPDDETCVALLALALHADGQVEQAAEGYRLLTVLRPETHEYWSNLGLMLGQLDRFVEAESAYRHALSFAPWVAV